MSERSIRLTHEQYSRILLKIKEAVDQPGFRPAFYDSTTVGDKYTTSNCGFCNDEFTDEETSLWPDQFPKRKSMKYREDDQRCPFDTRKEAPSGYAWGCFYHCYLFQGKSHSVEEIRRMVREAVDADK